MRKVLAALALAFCLSGFAASVTKADYMTGDPRKCSGSRAQTTCAWLSAKAVVVHYMRAHTSSVWSNPLTCVEAGTVLKWHCDFGTGTAEVWFRGTHNGWVRQITVTMKT